MDFVLSVYFLSCILSNFSLKAILNVCTIRYFVQASLSYFFKLVLGNTGIS